MEIIKLELDKVLYPDGSIPGHVKLERRIVKGLVEHLKAAGFELMGLNDGEEEIETTDLKEAMEHIFNLDESHIYFKSPAGQKHWIFLVHGNGVDIISDYGVPKVSDGFDEAMDAFDPEQFE